MFYLHTKYFPYRFFYLIFCASQGEPLHLAPWFIAPRTVLSKRGKYYNERLCDLRGRLHTGSCILVLLYYHECVYTSAKIPIYRVIDIV